MKIINAKFINAEETIVDVEIEHPQYGWIPYTFKYDDKDTSFDSEIRKFLDTANITKFIEYTQTVEELLMKKLQEAQLLLDSTQFKFGEDYDQKNTPEWLALKARRQEAREFIRANNV